MNLCGSILFGCLIAAGALAVVLWLLLRPRKRRRGSADKALARLKAHYVRLGCCAPDSPCPCGKGATYLACCRGKDVRKLEANVISHLLQQWSHKSYLGRRRNYTMAARLAEHPLPEPSMPDWVTHPEHHTFPISSEVLLAWTPLPPLGEDQSRGAVEDAGGSDVPL